MTDPAGRDDRERSYTVLADRDDVRRWADDNDVVPARRRGDDRGDDVELVRGGNLGDDYEAQDWDTFHERFDDRNLAVVHGTGASDGSFRLVDRDDVDEGGELDDDAVEELLEGEPVTTEVTEREVVEREVVTEATIESEVVESRVVDSQVVDTEVVGEELVGVAVAERTDAEVTDDENDDRASAGFAYTGDGERGSRAYFGGEEGHTVEVEESGVIGLDVDETRLETEERLVERTVESRVVDAELAESDVGDDPVEVDVGVDSVHEHIGHSGVLETDADGSLDDRYLETEFDGPDLATSTVTEHRTVETEVTERKVVYASIADVDVEDSERVGERVVERSLVESGESAGPSSDGPADAEAESGTGTTDDDPDATAGRQTPEGEDGVVTGRLMGLEVELTDGTTLGIVSDIDGDGDRLYVDEDPGLTDKLKADLHWSDGGDAVLDADQVLEIRRDAVVVDGRGDSA